MDLFGFGGSKRPPPTAKPAGKGGGLRPPPFPMGCAVGGGHLDPQNRRFPAPGQKPGINRLAGPVLIGFNRVLIGFNRVLICFNRVLIGF